MSQKQFASGISLPNSMVARDRASVFHSGYDPLGPLEPLIMERGDGIRIIDEDGNSYIDAMAGMWCASLGFSNERIAKVAYEQMLTMPFYHTFFGRSHRPMVELSEKLISLAPSAMSKVYLANSGSEANDTAIKLVWYYNNALGRTKKKKIIGRFRGYHGITVASGSVTGMPINQQSFDLPLPGFVHTMLPHYYHNALPHETEEDFATRCAEELEALINREGADTIAAMFMEPIMGGAGVIVPPRTYGEKMQSVLRKHDILLVADEVINGFGRTGNYWGSQTVGLQPDILTCAKALSAAFLPISALLMSAKVADAVSQHAHQIGVFAHGYTYSGHPVPTAVALEVLKIYDEMDIVTHVREVGGYMKSQLLERLGPHPLVGEIRGEGLLFGIELVEDKATKKNFAPERKVITSLLPLCQKQGLLVRPTPNDSIALSPPLIVKAAEVDLIVDKLEIGLNQLVDQLSRAA